MDEEITPICAALGELKSIIAKLEKDIKYFEWEALSDEEKRKIELSNEQFSAEHAERMRRFYDG